MQHTEIKSKKFVRFLRHASCYESIRRLYGPHHSLCGDDDAYHYKAFTHHSSLLPADSGLSGHEPTHSHRLEIHATKHTGSNRFQALPGRSFGLPDSGPQCYGHRLHRGPHCRHHQFHLGRDLHRRHRESTIIALCFYCSKRNHYRVESGFHDQYPRWFGTAPGAIRRLILNGYNCIVSMGFWRRLHRLQQYRQPYL